MSKPQMSRRVLNGPDITMYLLHLIWKSINQFQVLQSVSEEVASAATGLLSAAQSSSTHQTHQLGSGHLLYFPLHFFSSFYSLTSHSAIILNHAEDTFPLPLWISSKFEMQMHLKIPSSKVITSRAWWCLLGLAEVSDQQRKTKKWKSTM